MSTTVVTAGLVVIAGLTVLTASLVVSTHGPVFTPGRTLTAPRLPVTPRTVAKASPRTPPLIHHIVGLGDSVPAGSACSCTSYVSLVAKHVAAAQHASVKTDNLSAPGLTTAGLIGQLHQSAVTAALSNADIAIVTIGANDLEDDSNCSVAVALECYESNLRALQPTYARLLRQLHNALPPRARIFVTGYWNVFLDGAVARQQGVRYVRNSSALTKLVNGVIASTAAAESATYVDVYTAFKGDGDRDDTNLLAGDGDHPNAAGHAVIAEAINSALFGD